MAVALTGSDGGRATGVGARIRSPRNWVERDWWLLSALTVAVLAAIFVLVAGARPEYDAMGFLVWGHQALHLTLNLDGAPSWKPLPFLATLPYALAGHAAQGWLWTFTAAFGAIAAVALAGRLAYRLTPVAAGRTWARWAAALIAAVGIASMVDMLNLTLVADSDPLTVALVLAAIECHLSHRRRTALVLLWLVALGRPEAWAFLLLYAAWIWRVQPSARWLAVGSIALVAGLWFVIPALTSKSALLGSDFAMGQPTVIHGDKFVGVLERLRTLTAVPLQIAVLGTLGLAIWRRERPLLWLIGAAALWTAIEVVFALHGWSAVQRYLMEPGAVLIVCAGASVGTALTYRNGAMRWLGPVAVLALVLALGTYARGALRTAHGLISQAHTNALVLDRLGDAVSASGGPATILACGAPVTELTYQSALAWELNLNVATVNWYVPTATAGKTPVVIFRSTRTGWSVRSLHAGANVAKCSRLDRSA